MITMQELYDSGLDPDEIEDAIRQERIEKWRLI